jgi:hypothetical protein
MCLALIKRRHYTLFHKFVVISNFTREKIGKESIRQKNTLDFWRDLKKKQYQKFHFLYLATLYTRLNKSVQGDFFT